jgi:hypothetical protein
VKKRKPRCQSTIDVRARKRSDLPSIQPFRQAVLTGRKSRWAIQPLEGGQSFHKKGDTVGRKLASRDVFLPIDHRQNIAGFQISGSLFGHSAMAVGISDQMDRPHAHHLGPTRLNQQPSSLIDPDPQTIRVSFDSRGQPTHAGSLRKVLVDDGVAKQSKAVSKLGGIASAGYHDAGCDGRPRTGTTDDTTASEQVLDLFFNHRPQISVSQPRLVTSRNPNGGRSSQRFSKPQIFRLVPRFRMDDLDLCPRIAGPEGTPSRVITAIGRNAGGGNQNKTPRIRLASLMKKIENRRR